MISGNGLVYFQDMAVIGVAEMCVRLIWQKAVLVLKHSFP